MLTETTTSESDGCGSSIHHQALTEERCCRRVQRVVCSRNRAGSQALSNVYIVMQVIPMSAGAQEPISFIPC